jgi:hypothetical protein
MMVQMKVTQRCKSSHAQRQGHDIEPMSARASGQAGVRKAGTIAGMTFPALLRSRPLPPTAHRPAKARVGARPPPAVLWPPAAALLAAMLAAPAAQAGPGHPLQLYALAGATRGAEMTLAGAVWDTGWRRPWAGAGFDGTLSLHADLALGRWTGRLENTRERSRSQHVGLTPVLRFTPAPSTGTDGAAATRWFAEAGIGLNRIDPVYRGLGKNFSTTWNFGNHVALGLRSGERGQHEWSLRLQHFSNAGLRRPNPGENFVQLRWAWNWP